MPVEFTDLVLTDFSGGLNLRDTPASLKQNELYDVFNLIVTDEGQLASRPALFPLQSVYSANAIDSIFHWNQIGTDNDFVFYINSAGDLKGFRIGPIYDQGGDSYDNKFRRHVVNMMVGDDSDFENDVGNWTATETYPTITRDTGIKYSGAASMKLDYVGTGGSAQCFTAAQYASCPRVSENTNDKIALEGAWVYLPSANTGSQLVTFYIYQYDIAGIQLAVDTQTYDLSTQEDQWVWISTAEVIHDGTVYMRAAIALTGELAGDVMFIDNVFMEVIESWTSLPAFPSYYSTRGALDDPSINIGTLSPSELPGIAWTVFNDVLYVTSNGYTSDEAWKFDGTTWTQITDQNLNGGGNEFPFAKFLVNKHERVFAFNVDHSAGPDRSRIWYSEPGDPVTWGTLSWIDVDPDDGSEITGAVSFSDGIVIFKDHSVFYLSGVDENSFTLFPVQQGIGCQSPHTVQVVENQVIWFDATQGWFAFDGANILPISDKITSQVIEELYSDPEAVKHASSFVHRNTYYCSLPVNVDETHYGAPESSDNQLTYSLNIRNGAWSRHTFGFKAAINIDGLVYFGGCSNVGLDSTNTPSTSLWYFNTRTSSDWRPTNMAVTTLYAGVRPTTYFRTGLIKPGSSNDSFRFINGSAELTGGAFGRVYGAFDDINHTVWQSDEPIAPDYTKAEPSMKHRSQRFTAQRGMRRGYANWLHHDMAVGPSSAFFNEETNCSTSTDYTDRLYGPYSMKITRTGTGSANWNAGWGPPTSGLPNYTQLCIPGWVLKYDIDDLYYYLDVSYKILSGTINQLTFSLDIYDEEWTYINDINWNFTPINDGEWHTSNWNGATITERSFPFVPSKYKTYLCNISFDGTTTSDDNVVLVNAPWFSPTIIDLAAFNTFHSLSLGVTLVDSGLGYVWEHPVTIDGVTARLAQRRGPRTRYNSFRLET